MKKFKDLTIKCPSVESAILVLSTIRDYCTSGSFFCGAGNDDTIVSDEHLLRIETTLDNIPESTIIVYANENSVQVVNIVPSVRSVSQLTKEQYNEIVTTFCRDIIAPLFENKYEIQLTSEDVDIRNLIPQSYYTLDMWVNCPGAPNSPFSHPNDQNRWFSFICKLHDSGEILSSGDLEQWLLEDKQWPEDVVSDTIIRFETETELLDYYDRH